MSPETMLRINAIARLVIGAVLVAAPEWVGRRWIGRDGGRPAVTVLTRAIGARDVALGAGALAALSRGGDAAKPWAMVALVADGTDTVASALARDALPPGAGVASLAVAAGAAAQDAYIAARLGRNSA